MKKINRVVLSTFAPDQSKSSQLALYNLKAYYEKHRAPGKAYFDPAINVFSREMLPGAAAEKILSKKPKVIGFSCYVWNIEKTLGIARIIKKTDPKIIIVCGGPEVSPRAQELLQGNPGLDFIVRGEGEESFSELLDALAAGIRDFRLIRGISFRFRGKVISNPGRRLIPELDTLPSVYADSQLDPDHFDKIHFESSRGCPFKCHYCYDHKNYGRLRYFSLERISSELKYILHKKPREVYFIDSTFNADPERAKRVLRSFIKYNQGTLLHLELRAELLDKQLIRMLKRANARLVEIGMQSMDPRILRSSNRSFSKRAFFKNLRELSRQGIEFQVDLMAGLPGQAYADVKKSLDWIWQFQPKSIQIFPLMVLPGTYFRQNAERLGLVYEKKPPYILLGTRNLSAKGLQKVFLLQFALVMFLEMGIFKNTARRMQEKLRLDLSKLLEEWLKRQKRSIPEIMRLCSFRGGAQLRLPMDPFIEDAPDFVKYLGKKYNRPRLYSELYPFLKDDLAAVIFEKYALGQRLWYNRKKALYAKDKNGSKN